MELLLKPLEQQLNTVKYDEGAILKATLVKVNEAVESNLAIIDQKIMEAAKMMTKF